MPALVDGANRDVLCQVARDHGVDPDIVIDSFGLLVEYRPGEITGYVLSFYAPGQYADRLPADAVVRQVASSGLSYRLRAEVPYRGEWPPRWH